MPTRNLFKGVALRSMLWSSVGAVCLCLLMFDLYLIADLLDHRGELELPSDAVQELAVLTGDESTALVDEMNVATTVNEEDAGILPTVWWSRDTHWGPVLAALYRNVGMLRSNSNGLICLVLTALVIGLVRSASTVRARRMSNWAGIEITTRLRRALHRQALRLGPGDLKDANASQVLTLFTDEMERVRDGVTLWTYRLGRHPFELLLLVLLALSIHPFVAVQCLIPLGACWYLVRQRRLRFESSRYRTETLAEAEARLLAESFRKTRIIGGYGMVKFEHEQFRTHLDRFHANVLAIKRRENVSGWFSRVLVIFCVSIILYLVGSKVLRTPDDLSLASALLLLTTLLAMHWPLDAITQLWFDRENASLAADRIYRYLNEVPEVSQAVGAKFIEPLSHVLRFESVTYKLPSNRKLLNKLDLKVPAGSVTAIISMDQNEARALAYMLPRFIEPNSGRILIDDEDIAWATLESLRAETIYVGGDDPFFTGTVLQNINCGNESFSLQKVTDAAKTSHAHNFILKLSQGYETVIGEHGESLDAGQGFRLGLARAILRNPALMIIEEPATALNDDTKSLLDDAYNRIMADRTILFLPTRLSTLRRADHIVLIHEGKVRAMGDYATLVKKSQLYRHWEYLRFNRFKELS